MSLVNLSVSVGTNCNLGSCLLMNGKLSKLVNSLQKKLGVFMRVRRWLTVGISMTRSILNLRSL